MEFRVDDKQFYKVESSLIKFENIDFSSGAFFFRKYTGKNLLKRQYIIDDKFHKACLIVCRDVEDEKSLHPHKDEDGKFIIFIDFPRGTTIPSRGEIQKKSQRSIDVVEGKKRIDNNFYQQFACRSKKKQENFNIIFPLPSGQNFFAGNQKRTQLSSQSSLS